jgi:hypothetical protein
MLNEGVSADLRAELPFNINHSTFNIPVNPPAPEYFWRSLTMRSGSPRPRGKMGVSWSADRPPGGEEC